MTQPDLPLEPSRRECGPRLTKAQRFEAFHRDHPEVYRELVKLARQAKAAGLDRCGIRLFWEKLRWQKLVTKAPGHDFAMNDHFPPFYARMILEREPDLAGLFEVRGRGKA